MKAVVAAFNQEKALIGAFSVITNLRMELFEALQHTHQPSQTCLHSIWSLHTAWQLSAAAPGGGALGVEVWGVEGGAQAGELLQVRGHHGGVVPGHVTPAQVIS